MTIGIKMQLNWLVHQLRVTVFSAEPAILSEAEWTKITGQAEAPSRDALPGGKRYSGPFLNGLLSMSYTGHRTDLVLTFEPAEEATDGLILPTIGPFDDVLKSFVQTATPFLAELHASVVRIAVGAVLMCQAASREDSYEQLAFLVRSLKVDPQHMRELIYRVNWPQQSSVVPGLELNRITAFSSALFRQAQFVINPAGAPAQVQAGGPDIYATRLDLDHSSNQENTEPFNADTRVHIFSELIELVQKNAEAGERP